MTPLHPRADEHEIAAHCRAACGHVRAHIGAFGRRINHAYTVQELAGTLNGIAVAMGAKPVPSDVDLSGRIGRMLDPRWWSRNMRRELLRANEVREHAAGAIRRRAQCYATDHAVHRVGRREKVNRATLARLEVANEEGQAFNLLEVSDASVSNPALRRAELMTRCRGFEDVAKFMGHAAVFLTITCPSRFHRFDGNGRPNAKWDAEKSSPRQAQAYLNTTWKKIRAEWNRKGYAPYGFRVAEPHHDGCPHWHILLFAPPDHVGWFVPRRYIADRADHGAGLVGIAGAYALEDSAGEAGAAEHRFTVEEINMERGSATGYIAKYICKNIDGVKEDGEGMGLDFASGTPADKAARRVRTWASIWGIRQFQQIGGPSVTVWRELRKLGRDLEPGHLQRELFEGPRAAADRALWSLFWVLQGGPDAARADMLRPLYGYLGQGRYGDAVDGVVGVRGFEEKNEFAVRTRLHEWTVQRAGVADRDFECQEQRDAMERAEAVQRFLDAAGIADVAEFQGREATPWTGVNNCTDDGADDGADDENEAMALQLEAFWRSKGIDPYASSAPGGPRQLQ